MELKLADMLADRQARLVDANTELHVLASAPAPAPSPKDEDNSSDSSEESDDDSIGNESVETEITVPDTDESVPPPPLMPIYNNPDYSPLKYHQLWVAQQKEKREKRRVERLREQRLETKKAEMRMSDVTTDGDDDYEIRYLWALIEANTRPAPEEEEEELEEAEEEYKQSAYLLTGYDEAYQNRYEEDMAMNNSEYGIVDDWNPAMEDRFRDALRYREFTDESKISVSALEESSKIGQAPCPPYIAGWRAVTPLPALQDHYEDSAIWHRTEKIFEADGLDCDSLWYGYHAETKRLKEQSEKEMHDVRKGRRAANLRRTGGEENPVLAKMDEGEQMSVKALASMWAKF
ncbi:hypothetical protein SAICODRAFT_145379 [Saitoella complicata NRRL Y-17804]|uniref:uncharacterized protein n=1 Tax=Saitoella complicata (strain BCRC 22490 / CBS 7301 / JCM 7358 / NBRC 10748 / NRRL Y-17804) TaxID=698492 RepID=UPI000866DE86|nr:uncharacterized protein SAICODRAFT_145379 [Saitoella complicata NRRL Y-17804]ODQ51484.1 hypothetical protein SAICODRAFT_145379 [Saitoella complicata NRRL Y-17804]